jgi:hypothetical protein
LQRIKKLEQIFVGDRIGRRSREPPEEVIDGRPQQPAFTGFQVPHVIGRVGDRLRERLAAEPHLVDCGLQQGIECGRHIEVEMADFGEPLQHLGRGEGGILHNAADARVKRLAPAVPMQIERDHLVQCRRRRQRVGHQP